MATVSTPAQAANPKYAGIVIDAKSGTVLYSENPDSLRYPASLTKMMTLYLTFEALEAHRLELNSPIKFSKNAAAESPSKLGVKAGQSITVEQAILALVTRSANDAATALGETIGGSEAKFAQMMTNKAHALGMTRTTYRNAHGLPNTAQMTTARDQARLGIALRQHFPQYYGYFSTRSFRFGKQVIGNHNRLVGSVRGVDGIKTGYTRAAGFNLVSSAQLDGKSIVAVVLGGTSTPARDAQMRKLIATYLPKASRGGTSNLIASNDAHDVIPLERPVQEELTAAPHKVVTQKIRNQVVEQQTAYAEIAQTQSDNPLLASPSATSLTPDVSAVAVPAPSPVKQANLTVPETDENVDAVTTASTRQQIPSGWVVQVGISPSKKMAMELLEAAQTKGGKSLRSAKPFTVAYSDNGNEIYRARFGGFNNQRSAVNACKTLKKAGVNCWASAQ